MTDPAALHVLVVEDSADVGESLRDVLELLGHEVDVATDGPAALGIATRRRPDVVLCDIGLPGMDGYAVARAFRGDPRLRDIYLVALTGYAQPDDRRRAATAGFNAHLGKPASIDHLERLLDRIAAVRDEEKREGTPA